MMNLTELNHDEIRESILEIKLGFKKPALLKQLKTKYNKLFEKYIKTDKENITLALKTFKKKNLLEYTSSTSVDNYEKHNEFQETQDAETIALYELLQSQGILSETLTAFTLLNNTKALKPEIIIPDLVSGCFSVYEEIYNKSKVDIGLIREYAEMTTHFAIQELYSMLDDPTLKEIMAEGRKISNEQIEVRKVILNYIKDDEAGVDEKSIDKELGELYNKLHDSSIAMGTWQHRINDFISSTGYKELIKKHFETLGVDLGVEKVSPDEVYPSMSALDTFLDPSLAYYKLRQGPATNTFIGTDLRNMRFEVNQLNRGIVKNGNTNFIVYDFKEGISGVSSLSKELFTFIVLFLTNKGGDIREQKNVTIPIEQYLGIKGRTISKDNKKNAQKEIRKLMSELNTIRIDTLDGREGTRSGEINIFSSWEAIRGYIEIEFPTRFLKLLSNSYIMSIPRDLFKVDSRTNAFPLGIKILNHSHQNFFKSNKGIIGVKTLLKSCPEIPTLEELGDARQVSKRIIKPFERALEELEDKIKLSWNYCGKNGSVIEDPKNYNEFISSQILYEIGDYPERERQTRTAKKYRRKKKDEGEKKDA